MCLGQVFMLSLILPQWTYTRFGEYTSRALTPGDPYFPPTCRRCLDFTGCDNDWGLMYFCSLHQKMAIYMVRAVGYFPQCSFTWQGSQHQGLRRHNICTSGVFGDLFLQYARVYSIGLFGYTMFLDKSVKWSSGFYIAPMKINTHNKKPLIITISGKSCHLEIITFQ